MKVAINVKPLQDDNKFRGVGSYTRNLITHLKKLPIEVVEFSNQDELQNVDLVHYPYFDLFFHTLPINKKITTVVTIHDVMPLVFSKNYPVGVRGKINLQFQKMSLRDCRRIITDARISKKDVSNFLNVNLDKIDVIPLAAGNEFKILPRTVIQKVKSKLNLPDKFILYVGDVNYVKNIPTLIEAFHKLTKEDQHDLKLVLVGGSFLKGVENDTHPELESLKETNRLIKEYGLDSKVARLGQISIENLVAVYNLATLYIQPSFYEGFGIPLLEAMSCGCPVISSIAGSLPEVAGDAAVYFDPDDTNDLVSKILQVLSNNKLKSKLVKSGQERVKEFSWQKTAQQTVKVYEKSI